MRLIDADALIKATIKNPLHAPYITVLDVERAPTVAKRGHWILDPDGMDWNIPAWVCSICGCRNDNLPVMKNVAPESIMRFSGSKFCPNCGAKMYLRIEDNETN